MVRPAGRAKQLLRLYNFLFPHSPEAARRAASVIAEAVLLPGLCNAFLDIDCA